MDTHLDVLLYSLSPVMCCACCVCVRVCVCVCVFVCEDRVLKCSGSEESNLVFLTNHIIKSTRP